MYMYFKFNYSVSSEFFNTTSQSLFEKLFDIDRYVLILKKILFQFINFFKALFAVMLLVTILAPRKLLSTPFLILYGTFAMYIGIYVITPYDLEWHLVSSVYRIIFQFYPVLLFLGLYLMKDNLNRMQTNNIS